MKKLVLYYSFEGNTKLIAETIANELNADICRLVPVKEMESTGFSKYIWGGAKVVMKKKPKILPLDLNPGDYEKIYIGTPVWAWTYSPAIKTLLEDEYFSGKQVYFFCTHEGGLGKTIEHAKKMISIRNTFIDSEDFLNVKNDKDNQIKKARLWVNHIQKSEM